MARGRMYSALAPMGGQGFEDPWTARQAQGQQSMRQMQLQSFLQNQNQRRDQDARERMLRMTLDLEREKMGKQYGLRGEELGLRRSQMEWDRDWRSGGVGRQLELARGMDEIRRANRPAWMDEDPVSRSQRADEARAASQAKARQAALDWYRQQGLLGGGQQQVQAPQSAGDRFAATGVPFRPEPGPDYAAQGMAGVMQGALPGAQAPAPAPQMAQANPQADLIAAMENAQTPADMYKALAIARMRGQQNQPRTYLDYKTMTPRAMGGGRGGRVVEELLVSSVRARQEQEERAKANKLEDADRLMGEADVMAEYGDRNGANELRAKALEMKGASPSVVKKVRAGIRKPDTQWLRSLDPVVDDIQKRLTAEGSTFTEVFTGRGGFLTPTGAVRQEEQAEYESAISDIMTQALEQGVSLPAVRDYLEKRLKIGKRGSRSATQQRMQQAAREILNRVYQQARTQQVAKR